VFQYFVLVFINILQGKAIKLTRCLLSE